MRTRIAFFLTVFLLATLAIASDEPYLFPIEADGLWGYIDATGKIAL